jgi:enoyl-CoA hydratase/carnithine racemase
VREWEVRESLQELYVHSAGDQYNLGKPPIAAVGGAARGGGVTMAVWATCFWQETARRSEVEVGYDRKA